MTIPSSLVNVSTRWFCTDALSLIPPPVHQTSSVSISIHSLCWTVADLEWLILTGAIQGFESNVKVIKTQQGDAFVYAVESNDENTKTYKVVIGPIEIDVTIDVNKLTIVIEVYVTIPFVGKVQVAKAVGNLRDGVKLTIGYPPFVGGSLTVKLDGKDVVLEYSIDALGWNYHGKIVVFTLP
ncbi:hypothetical protein F5J12DRAFT_415299 [Pisolithus orientalis]|uniref:uncharacterized protein n=1 Tax=Pisolithus orientalis TaxID=936130 RepID=UPI002224C63A|nr:uncharacterized protein F5J12DRAFT_415299 [Pisolithus orientalis]KAI5994617.1 hypothetical protein F5J12DRAFT_415299 [Pisolithus orientalis]